VTRQDLLRDAELAAHDLGDDLPGLLDTIRLFVRRYVVLTPDQTAAVALWIFHTWVVDVADCTPYLSVTSALPRSGKTRSLEVLELLVREPMQTANISDAALFRATQKLRPTLLFDEIDAIFGAKARDREDLRGMLNAGYRRGAVALRMGGAGKTTLETFDVFCAKAFAGIGELPATIRDRTIRIRLERRIRDQEPIERFRRRDVAPIAEAIRDRLRALSDEHASALMYARPDLPDELDDRAQDVWEPLLAIADRAGGDWPGRARTAAAALSSDAEREDDSASVQLLRDIHGVFEADETEAFKTSDLIAQLAEIQESPWGDWYGKAISPQALGKLLKPYGIRTMPVWIDGQTVRGYKADQFLDAWLRVLGVRGVRGVRSGFPSQDRLTGPNALTPSENGGVRSDPASEAEPNAPNAPNALETNGRFCVGCVTQETCAAEHDCQAIRTGWILHGEGGS
jgi:Protein of unknown function (DUF3631)